MSIPRTRCSRPTAERSFGLGIAIQRPNLPGKPGRALRAALVWGAALGMAANASAAPAPQVVQEIRVRALAGVAVAPPDGQAAATPPTSPPSSLPNANQPSISLKGGGYINGSLDDSADAKTVQWRSPSFQDPFAIPIGNVSSINYPLAKGTHKSTGDCSLELASGDLIFGNLAGINETEFTIDTERFGKLTISRDVIHRVSRWKDGADLIYLGPNGLNGWKPAETSKDAWREESGRIVSDREGSLIVADLNLPEKFAIEFEIGWNAKPDFDLAFGTEADPKPKNQAFHFEVWDGNLVVQRETEQEADVESILDIGKIPKAGHATFVAYIDQTAGRIAVFSLKGQKLADLKVKAKTPTVGRCISLANKHGDVRLERLRINRWDGDAPKEALADQSRIHLGDGSVVYGKIVGFDSASKAVVVAVEQDKGEEKVTEETKVPLEKIEGFYLGSRVVDKPNSLRVMDQEGARLSGELLKIENQKVLIQVPGIKEPVGFPIANLASATPLNQETPKKLPGLGPIGTLEIAGARIEGNLVDGEERPGISCLNWKPVLGSNASALKLGVAGKIVLRDPSTLPKPAGGAAENQPQIAQPRGLANLRNLNSALGKRTDSTVPGHRNLYLRTGDVIPSEITKIDENGINFKTALSDSTFVGHEKVKAIELGPEPPNPPRITKTKRDRLLTLPRMQKDSPPLQLIRSMNGDYLRGRIVLLDDKTLQIETRLETKVVPRERVSKIIWLHPEELNPPVPKDPNAQPPKPETEKAPAPAPSGPTRIQAVRSDGVRLTFTPASLKERVFNGKSDVLGVCRVPIESVDQILIGDEIERTAAQLAYQQWKLQNAPEPKYVNALGSDGGSPARSESPLVGKPAPDFSLELLDGKTFKLSEHRGKVVMLDFWATWCGPCLQAMPQVEKVAGEFKDQGVELIAVNLQEASAQIKSLLERQKLDVNVALDVDGAVAEKYQANAIPQTVIIGRNGNVEQLFVGGGTHFDDTLRDALKTVLGTANPNPSPAASQGGTSSNPTSTAPAATDAAKDAGGTKEATPK